MYHSGNHHHQVVPGNWQKSDGVVGAPSGAGGFNGQNHFNAISETTVMAFPSGLYNAALTAARNKIKGQTVDLGTAWGERKQTSRQLGDTATSIGKAVRNLRRGNVRDAMRDLGISSAKRAPRGSNWINNWLALQYGWKPLLSDIYGSCSALAKRDKSDWRVTAKSGRREMKTWEYWLNPYNYGNIYGHHLTVEAKYGVFVRIDALPDNDLTMSLSSLGVTNPLNVAWELVPYSFVVDWFLPIGDWLASLDAMLGYTSAYTSVSYRTEAVWTDVGLSKDFSQTSFIRNNWTGTKRKFVLNRTAQAGVPLASFPSIKDGWSLGHMANGLALLASAFGRN